MARLDVIFEQRAKLEREALLLAVYGGLEKGVGRAGGQLLGLSIKLGEFDCLMTLRARFPAGMMVGFVGGTDIAHCMRKAAVESARDQVKWRPDKWNGKGG